MDEFRENLDRGYEVLMMHAHGIKPADIAEYMDLSLETVVRLIWVELAELTAYEIRH